ncbi:heterokaryon incompatibility protein [Fusarium denticulatum]|uniref:Heterokaryon incompatibility protein n=1 Tax=Fusarium denticulatum TaxID=48507 RepID=A0A8H5T6B3_9HYPO|nr:heterokaryon incompatibility protein [Fusarium denticulatum]
MTKVATVLMTLLGVAFAQIDRTCIDIAFNSETNTLSGKCQPRDNSGYIPSELDLNDCFGYDGTAITSEKVAVPLAREFKGLCLLSPSLSRLYLPFHYFSNNHGAFRDAIRDADVKVLDLCVQLGAAPPAPDMSRMKWQLPETDGCQCLSELPHTDHRPIDELLESVYLGRALIGKCVDTLKWLLDRGCDMIEQGDQNWYKGNEHCDHVPEFLVTILSKSPDRTRIEGICQMINLLQIHGYSLPFTMNMHAYWTTKGWLKTPDRSSPGMIMKPVEVALRSHCPPYFLELVLRDYMRRLVKFKVSHVRPPPLMDRWAGDYSYVSQGADRVVKQPWWKFTNLLDTAWGLFLDLIDESTSWKEQYRGEAADIFEQKIDILKEYRVANLDERKMLRKIVKAMRSLTTPINASISAVAHDREAQRCWETLYGVLIPFTSMRGIYVWDDDWSPLTEIGEPEVTVIDIMHSSSTAHGMPTIDLPWGNMGIVKKDDGRWQGDEWRRVADYEDWLPRPEINWDEPRERVLELLKNWRLPSWVDGHTYEEIEKLVGESCMDCLRPPVMDKSNSNNCHIAIVAPLPEDYEAARVLLDELQPECHLKSSAAACSLGKVGPHNVVLVGKADDMTNGSLFVKATVDDLLENFSSIRAGFLIGVDATVPEDSPAKLSDIVVGFPQGRQPGLIQFDADETTISSRISTTFEMSHPPSSVISVINEIYSPEGRRHWAEYLKHQSSRAELASAKGCQPLKQDPTKPNKVLRGKVASSTRLFCHSVINKVGSDNKIMCFERAGASIKSRLPFLTICGIVDFTGQWPLNLDESSIHQTRIATVICTMFILHRISAAKLGKEHATPNLFQYDSFDLERPGFRLMLLEKGVQPQLRCQIVQAYLDEELIFAYEALSYSWGRHTTLHEIVVDEKILSISESLHEALCHLRNPDEDRMLWVDALCIDQNNIEERGHQVDRMGEIYKKADRVIIWLGYLSGGNVAKLKSAVDMFKEELPLHAFREWTRQDERWQQQWKQTEASMGLYSHNELVDGLQIAMGNPWFSRVWILQEVANAKRAIVECNLGNIPARLFAVLPYAMDVQVGEQCQAVLDIMPSPLKDSSWWDQNRSLCNLMWKFRGCQATDLRDRVYALLGMASDLEDTGTRAEYAKDERAVMQDLCDYLLGDACPAQQSLATNIRDLQAQLPAISMELLRQKLHLRPTNNSLRAFLKRQVVIGKIDDQHFLDLVQHGSRIMSLFLDKSESPIHVTRDTALKVLETSTDVFEFLWKSPDFIIESLPEFAARAMECDAEIVP